MPVSVLRLHDLCAVDSRLAHVLHVPRLVFWVLGVRVRQRVRPHLVDLDGFLGIGGFLQDVCRLHCFLSLVVFFTLCEQRLLCWCGDLQRRDVDWSLSYGVQRDHREGTGHEDVFRQSLLIPDRRLRDLQRDFHTTPTRGERHLSAELEVTDLPDGVLQCDPVHCCGHSADALACVLVSDDAGQRVQVHQECTRADLSCVVGVGVEEPLVLLSKHENESIIQVHYLLGEQGNTKAKHVHWVER